MTNYLASATQYVEVTIAGGATSGTATITAVGSLAVAIFCGFTTPETSGNQGWARVTLTSSTVVTANRNTSDATNAVVVRVCVLDPNSSLVDTVQYGTITSTNPATSGTAAITGVDTSVSTVIYLGVTTDNVIAASADTYSRVTLTDTDTVTLNRDSNGNSVTGSFVVVEFQSAVINSVQTIAVTSTSTSTTISSTISAVTLADTLYFFGGLQSNNSTQPNSQYRSELTATTTVTHTRTGTNSSTRTVNGTVVEFVSGVLTSNQTGNTPVASTTSADEAVTAVDVDNAVIIWGGYSTTATAAPEAWSSAKLLDLDTVRAQKNTGGSTTSTPAWIVAEFDVSVANVVAGGMQSLHGFVANYAGQGSIDPGIHKLGSGI